jgi:tetratricopeptide (TPR) repeat protein
MWKRGGVMSFELLCESCGAASGPSVGVCPFCKSTMISKKSKELPAYSKLKSLYAEGKVHTAICLANEVLKHEKHLENASLLLLCAQILIESEGPNGKVKNILAKAMLADPENPQILEYIELTDAKFELSHVSPERGKDILEKLLRRSPDNVHAMFLLGSHLCWREQAYARAIPLLHRCVQLRPVFQRAWACLGVASRKIGQEHLAQESFRRCLKLESTGTMRAHLEKLLDNTEEKAAA